MDRGAGTIFALLTTAVAAAVSAAGAPCAMAPAERRWIDQALRNWRVAERDLLKLAPAPLPTVVVADARCQFEGSRRGLPLAWRGRAHHGQVRLPDGKSAPIGVMSFAGEGSARVGPFFVMALPSVWRSAGVRSPGAIETLMDGVLLHEMMHSRQFAAASPVLAAMEKSGQLPADLSDDSLQEQFSSNSAYRAAYLREVDTMYAAIFEPDDQRALALTRSGIAQMTARRSRWLGGADGAWGRADRLFLGMEGLGQWLIYRWSARHLPIAVTPDQALVEATRRNRKWWSQDEGLALFLLLDRFKPNWREGGAASDPLRDVAMFEAL